MTTEERKAMQTAADNVAQIIRADAGPDHLHEAMTTLFQTYNESLLAERERQRFKPGT